MMDLQEVKRLEMYLKKSEFRLLRKRLDRENLYKGDPMLLMIVANNSGLTQSEIAKKLCVKPATLTVMLQRMEGAGLVIRHPSPRDQRSQLVYITEEGKRISGQTWSLVKDLIQDVYRGISEEEMESYRRILERIQKNVDLLIQEDSRSKEES
ncbi:MAG: MarR family transcriptional regulator [Candidatus Limivivens sp.]|nr:MarR family transcriptional regulator [Candidatus Limivivens sp.]